MIVEDRAQLMLEEIPNQKPWEGKEELKAKFIKHLRDQIEDCAKILDRYVESERVWAAQVNLAVEISLQGIIVERLSKEIRALAGSTPTEEGKESER